MKTGPTSRARRAAAFINEYEHLCRKYGAMVVMTGEEATDWQEEGYMAFAVGFFRRDTELLQALEEMRIEEPFLID